MSPAATGIDLPAVERDERPGIWFIANLATVHVASAETGDAYCVVELAGASGDTPPLHVHHADDEVFYVLEGELELHVGADGPVRALPGTCVRAPRGVPHTYRVVSDEPARWIVMNAPGGFDRFVTEAGDPAGEPTLPPADLVPDMARVLKAAARCQIEILGPPGALPRDLA